MFLIDRSLLLPIGNTIEVVSKGSNLDDLLIRNVRFEIALENDVPPGGYSDNTGAHEFVVHVSP